MRNESAKATFGGEGASDPSTPVIRIAWVFACAFACLGRGVFERDLVSTRGTWNLRKQTQFGRKSLSNQDLSSCNPVSSSRIFSNLQQCAGIFRNLQESSGIFRNLQESSGIFRNLQFAGVLSPIVQNEPTAAKTLGSLCGSC
jgi:hypothetical protein